MTALKPLSLIKYPTNKIGATMKNNKIYTIPTSSYSVSACSMQKTYSLRNIAALITMCLSTLLVSCASESLKAPCPDYGKHCDQTPVNSWDTTTV